MNYFGVYCLQSTVYIVVVSNTHLLYFPDIWNVVDKQIFHIDPSRSYAVCDVHFHFYIAFMIGCIANVHATQHVLTRNIDFDIQSI